MIYGISGKPGGGKSYECVVNHIIPTVTKDKRKIVTNIPLNIEHFVAVYGEYTRDLIEVVDGEFHNFGGERPFSRIEHFTQYEDWQNEQGLKVFFFIDEAHLALPNRGQRVANEEIREWFSMARHSGFDIMLMSQFLTKVHREIRELISVHYRAIKKDFIGRPKHYVLKVHSDASTRTSSVVATHERTYDKNYFNFYKSHTNSSKSVVESSPQDVKPWYKSYFIYGSALVFLLAIFSIASGFSESEKPKPKQFVNTPVNSESVINQSVSNSPISAEVKFSDTKPRKPKHPFYKVDLHISGWADYTELGKRKKEYHFSASQNGQYIFELNLRDLILAGYDVFVRSPCMIEIVFDDYMDYLTCDSPKVRLDVPDNAPNSESTKIL